MPDLQEELGGTSCAARSGRGRHKRALMETALLLLLAQRDAHGYQLLDEVEARIGSQICVDVGSTYRALRVLEQGGFVESTWKVGESGPSKRVYRITPAGRRLLREWAAVIKDRGEAMVRLAQEAEAISGTC